MVNRELDCHSLSMWQTEINSAASEWMLCKTEMEKTHLSVYI